MATLSGIGTLALLTSTSATTESPATGRRYFLTWLLSAVGVAVVGGVGAKLLQ
ncbi:MAG: hypothetical protein R2706_10810 [Acidimicrobiales bacterium]